MVSTGKSYGEYCALARSLDRVGDRWTLLIVRELLVKPARFTELQNGLPGIATNLLSERLRRLEHDGIVERRVAAEPDGGVHYALTTVGEQLRSVVHQFIRWGSAWMTSGRGDDAFQPHWLSVAIPALARPKNLPRRTLRLSLEDGLLEVRGGRDGLRVSEEVSNDAHATLTCTAEVVLAIVAGQMTLEHAVKSGRAKVMGDRSVATELLLPR
jgi:DNA-binding HxlR family transcriptional regulator